MTRGNQRDLARAKNQKKLAAQKGGNAMTGSELAKHKEDARKIMMDKQAKGAKIPTSNSNIYQETNSSDLTIADAKKKEAEEAALKAKAEKK